jgi:Holliday junction resolvasome RuvABC DNA-binding subunit
LPGIGQKTAERLIEAAAEILASLDDEAEGEETLDG